jgi:uncharacterized membrane protein
MPFHPNQKYSYSRWVADTRVTSPAKPEVFRTYTGQTASPLLYLPQVAGILAGRALFALVPFRDMPFNWSEALYFARLGNLVAFAITTAVCMAWAGRYRAVLAAVAMLPMTLQAASSASYDTPVIIVAMIFFALMARLATQAGGPSRRQYVALLVLAFLIGHAKAVYAPILLLTLIFKRRQDWRTFLLSEAGLLAAALLGVLSVSWFFGSAGNPDQAAAFGRQIEFLKHHPLAAPHVTALSLWNFREFYVVSLLGEMGWLDTNFAVPVLVLTWGVLICATVGDALAGPSPFGWIGSGSILVAVGLSVLAVFTAMYIMWTSQTSGIGVRQVDGVQGRYFLPLLPFAMAMIAAAPRWVAARAGEARQRLLQTQLTVSTAILALAWVVVMLRYWAPAT